MIYSVWNQSARKYDYFRSMKRQETANTPSPKHIRGTRLGSTVEQAAWPLPSDARKIGSGDIARGRIASMSSGKALGGFNMDTNTVAMIGFGVAAFVLWRSGFLKA